MKNKRIIALILCCALMLAVLAGCGSSSTPAASTEVTEEYDICVFMPNAGDPYYQNKSYGYGLGAQLLEAANPGLKINITMYDAGGYEYVEKQISQVEDAIQRGVDAIILTACDGVAVIPVVTQAMEAGIPVINDEAMISMETTCSLSEYSYRVGTNQAAAIAKAMGYEGNVVMLKGPASSTLFADRERGAHDEFAGYEGINILAEQWNESNIEDARRVMEDFISTYGKDIDAVYTGAAVSAFGAIEALKSAGFEPGEVVIATIDLHDEALQYMEDGWMLGTIPCQPVKLAKLCVNAAYNALKGIEVPPVIYTTDDTVITLEDYATFDLSDSEAPEGYKPSLS